MTEPTKEEIERVAREIYPYLYPSSMDNGDDGEPGQFETRIAKWHLQKLEEQRAKYYRLVLASETIYDQISCDNSLLLVFSKAMVDELRDALAELESK